MIMFPFLRFPSSEYNTVNWPLFTTDRSKVHVVPFLFFFLPLPFKHPDSGPACSQSHFRGIFLEIDGRFFLFLFFFPQTPSPSSLPPHRFDKITKENIHLVCNNNVDSLKGRKETVETLHITRSPWKPPFFFLSDRKTSNWPDLTKSGRRDAVVFDTSSQGSRHFLSPVTTFSGRPLSKYSRTPPAALQGGQARQFLSGSPLDVWSGSTGR